VQLIEGVGESSFSILNSDW